MGFVAEVLCIDDDQDDLLFIKEAIAGYRPEFSMVEVLDGSAALEFLNKAKKEDRLPCLIIMDINMPKMDGKKTIPFIKNDPVLRSIPLVVFTTSSNISDRRFFEDFDVIYITKPAHYEGFVKKVREMLEQFPRI